jgi:hypothetical protein
MNIGLHDDNTGFPNLALMKLSAFHKAKGDHTERFIPLMAYDKVYSSKVFTFTQPDGYLPEGTEKGGIGYGDYKTLPEEIEHMMPDYDLYGKNYSMGFLTRGCIRKCSFCFVPRKEGSIRAHADIEEFLKHRDVVLLDNNVLAHEHGLKQIEKMARLNLRVDFNQGLDARLIDDPMARLLGRLTWLNAVRLACDSVEMIPTIKKAVELLRWNNVTPSQYFCYVLVRGIPEALQTVKALKGIYVYPFCQTLVDDSGSIASDEQRAFCRWVNHRAVFRSTTWEDYKQTGGAVN